MLLVFLNTYRNNPQAHEITIVAFHLEVFRVSYFPQGMKVNLLSSSSKDNTRVELVEVDMDSYGYMVYEQINSTSTCLLRALAYAWSTKRYWPIALCHIRTWGITKDGHAYHHLPPTPQSEDTISTTTLALYRVMHLYQEPSTIVSAIGTDDKTSNK